MNEIEHKHEVVRPNLNFTTPTNFVARIHLKNGIKKEPLDIYVQEFETPILSKGYATRKKGNKELLIPSTTETKTPLTLNYVCDNEFYAYTDILDIFHGKTELERIDHFLTDEDDYGIVVLSYHDPIIVNIGSLSFDLKNDGMTTVTFPVEIIYSDFNHQRITS